MYTENTDVYAFARPYLAPGETILWRGKPVRGRLFTPADVIMIPFSIFWCGFALFWEFSVISIGALPMAVFGIPFVCIGLYLTVGRFFHRAHQLRHTAYVITTGKIIRRQGNRIDMLDTGKLPPIHVTARTDGTGTIRFGQPVYYRIRRSFDGYDSTHFFTLDNIPEVARVQQLLHTIAID